MSRIVPVARPEMARSEAEKLISAYGVKGPALLGRRGYYRDSMGKAGVNERGIYDDAIFIVTPTFFKGFNANCDPSRIRPGMAVLKAGVWDYRVGIHNISKDPKKHPHYQALVQAAPVTVARDGQSLDTGFFGINIHKGGYGTTSSEGCQTIYPTQWGEFIKTLQEQMNKYGITKIPYVLTEREDLEAAA